MVIHSLSYATFFSINTYVLGTYVYIITIQDAKEGNKLANTKKNITNSTIIAIKYIVGKNTLMLLLALWLLYEDK